MKIRKNKEKITKIREKIISRNPAEGAFPAVIMFVCTGIFILCASGYDASAAGIPEQASELTVIAETVVPAGGIEEFLQETEALKTEAESTAETETEASPEPELYLASMFREGQDRSLAEVLIKELSGMDSGWFAHIYDLAGTSGNVNITFLDGDGKTAYASSNIQDIVSMTSVYAERTGTDNWTALRSYAAGLWRKSHSYSVGESSTYFCDGCVEPEETGRNGAGNLPGTEIPKSSAADSAVETDRAPAAEVLTPSDSIAAETVAVETTAPHTVETDAEKRTENQRTEATGPEKAKSEAAESKATGPETTNQETTNPEMEGSETKTSETESPKAETSEAEEPESDSTAKVCPGHTSIQVTVAIAASEDTNGLFALDTQGQETVGTGSWEGWTDEAKELVWALRDQNWMEKYGLTMSVKEMDSPLSSAEIESYMSLLPADISEVRRSLVRFALQSVGKVPYYWGGKPSASGYAGNQFGMITAPDPQGRTIRGLDCSGWISWVYWSAGNGRLKYEGTGGLKSLGRTVTRGELKPGDIAVMTGDDSHVIMYLGTREDGTMLCIHESSGRGTVSVSIMKNTWTNYRNLLD